MQTPAMIVWIYGALVLAGGVMGWVKARSKPSLISGIVFGAALIVTGFAIERPSGHWTALGLAAGLTILMSVRFAKSRKFIPAGMIALLSLVVVVALSALR
jgi:uncharacterized membrane protein (UPF0136 family)